MVVTLEWIRDHYDNNPRNRYIDGAEYSMAVFDESRRTITKEQLDAVKQAWSNHVLLPEGDTPILTNCVWISTKDTSRVVFISEMVLAYNKVGADIGFVPTAKEISDGVLMYGLSKTPASLWGC